MRKVACIALAALAGGCASHSLSPEGKQVRVITPSVAVSQNCKHLGLATARGVAIEGGMAAAQIKIRNQVAEAGGNAMVVTNQYIEPGQYEHGNITVDAYRCPG